MSVIHTAAADGNQTPVGAGNALPVSAVVTGTTLVAGPNASDSASVMAPLIGGSVARSAAQAAVSAAGDTVADFADLSGRKIVKPLGVNPSHDFCRIAPTTTTETTLIGAVASNKHDVQSITVANRDTVQATVDLRDTTGGPIRLSVVVPAGETQQLTFPAGLPSGGANTNWTAQLRAATTTNAVEISTSSYRTTA